MDVSERSSLGGANGAPSDAISLSQQAPTTDSAASGQNPVSKVIWGTNVSIGESMQAFRAFLRGFRLKYRWAHSRDQGTAVAAPLSRTPADGETLVYEGYLRRMRMTDQTNLNLRIPDLAAFPPARRMAMQLANYPQEMIPIMDQVLKDEMIEMAIDDARAGRDGMEGEAGQAEIEEMEGKLYKVRPFGGDSINMRDLNPSGKSCLLRSNNSDRMSILTLWCPLSFTDIDKLVTVRGLVIRTTPVIPDMKAAFFRCLVCNHTVPVEIDRGRIAEPDACPRDVCNAKGAIALIHNRCEFADRQVVRLQETPDVVPDGQTPHTVSLCVYDELVDVCKPGDRIEVTGIFRSVPVRINPRQRTLKSLYKTYLDVVHVKRGNARRMGVDASTRDEAEAADGPGAQAIGVGGEDDDADVDTRSSGPGTGTGVAAAEGEAPPSEELAEKMRNIAARPDVYELLARSLAPSIYEMDDVKKGILLQLFGGTNKSITRGGGAGGPRYRGDINVLMVGDPGTSKSQILMVSSVIFCWWWICRRFFVCLATDRDYAHTLYCV